MGREACEKLKERMYKHAVHNGQRPDNRAIERKAQATAERADNKAKAKRR